MADDGRTETLARRAHPRDPVAILLRDVPAGGRVRVQDAPDGAETLQAREAIPRGHKIALRDLPAGTALRKHGEIIGETTRAIPAGAHVHVHNLASRRARAEPAHLSTSTPGDPS